MLTYEKIHEMITNGKSTEEIDSRLNCGDTMTYDNLEEIIRSVCPIDKSGTKFSEYEIEKIIEKSGLTLNQIEEIVQTHNESEFIKQWDIQDSRGIGIYHKQVPIKMCASPRRRK